MTLNNRQLDLRIAGCALALSARRIWEHTEFGQVNPFAPVPASGDIQPEAYVDLVNMSGPVQMLAGLTLEDAIAGRQTGVVRVLVKQLLQHVGSAIVRNWLADVRDHLVVFAQERAPCHIPPPFLVRDSASPFGVRGLHSSLKSWLNAQGTEKASVEQWHQRIDNLTRKGLHADELAFCGLNDTPTDEADRVVTGDVMADCMHFDALRLSILPAVHPAHAPLEFIRVPANTDIKSIKRIKPKLKSGFQLRPQWRDRMLGYRIDIVEWTDLLGQMRGWMVSTHRGEPVVAHNNPSGLCASLDEAMRLAKRHAEKLFPKTAAQDGGAECHAWLVTLPYYAPSYFSGHFEHRNVLLYLRCEMREGLEGERVLFLQEARSDWSQQARQDRKEQGGSSTPIPMPPWLHEWPALALKLMLLHAAQCGAHALAWTTGDIQRMRDGGLEVEEGLALYDRTLPAEASQLLRPYGKKCERVELLQPANFFIDPTDGGYEVLDQFGEHLGMAARWEEAQAMLPDGAQEVPAPMHRVVLDDALKRAILADGFCAWGPAIDPKA